jgi:type II secretion system protein N
MKTIGYSLLALILFYLFLLMQFPYEAIKENLARSFAQLNMGKLKIGKVRPFFPFDLSLQNISWNSENMGMQIPDLIMGLNIIKTVLGKTEIEIKDLKNPQRLQGKYYQEVKEGSLRLLLDHTELKVAYKNNFSLSVSISGEAKLRWLGQNYEKVNGEFWALLQRREIEVRPEERIPLFLKTYDNLRAEVQVQDGNFWVKRLVVSGKESKEIVWRDLNLNDLLKRSGPALGALLELAPIAPQK